MSKIQMCIIKKSKTYSDWFPNQDLSSHTTFRRFWAGETIPLKPYNLNKKAKITKRNSINLYWHLAFSICNYFIFSFSFSPYFNFRFYKSLPAFICVLQYVCIGLRGHLIFLDSRIFMHFWMYYFWYCLLMKHFRLVHIYVIFVL